MTNQIWYLEKKYMDEVNDTVKMYDDNNQYYDMEILLCTQAQHSI